MVVELVFVGTELLLGNIVNTNGAYLSEMCAALGLSSYYQTVVGDNHDRLKDTMQTAVDRSDVVIVCGGLGPTEDDLTKETAAEVFKKELVEDKHTRKLIESYMENYIKSNPTMTVTDNNWKQALIPEGAKVLDNANGTAPGIIIEENGKMMVLLPGPPNELIPMFQNQVYPYLHQLQPEVICSRMVKICGMGESMVETDIKDLIDSQVNPTIATYAKTGEVHLRITARAETEKAAQKLIKPLVRELKVRFGTNIYTTDEDKTLEEAIIELMQQKGLTLSTAESCTGGMLSSRLVNVPGASDVFKDGFITYSNKAKRKYLMVKKSTLKIHGAVSEKTAKEMAKGGSFVADTDVCVAVTGIAGPDGGTEEKPVGLVYIACSYKKKVYVQELRLNGNRMKIREQATVKALTLLRDCILENFKNKEEDN